jgi:hypothetical protein
MSESAQAGVDEAGRALDIGGHQFAEHRRYGGVVQVPAQAVGLDVPQAEQGPGRDLRFRVVCGHPGPRRENRGGRRGALVRHVGLVGAQRGRGPD